MQTQEIQFSLLFTPLKLTNVTFTDNISKEQSLGLFATFSSLTIQNSTFIIKNLPNSETNQSDVASSTQITGCFILIGSSATLAITGSHFESGYSNYGGAIYISGNSDITISDTIFKNWYSSISGGAVYATGFKAFKLNNWNFEGNSWGSAGTDLWIKSGESHIKIKLIILLIKIREVKHRKIRNKFTKILLNSILKFKIIFKLP